LLPRAEIEPPSVTGHDDFAPHDLPLVVRVAVVFAGAVVVVAFRARIVRREPFQPTAVVVVKPRLVVVDEHARRDVHRVNEAQAVAYARSPSPVSRRLE
jgi:hypothetical protein